MIDTEEFAKRFREKLIEIAAENHKVLRLEAMRKYHTDPKFHATVETLVLTAVQIIKGLDVAQDEIEPLREVFHREANDLLGWSEH